MITSKNHPELQKGEVWLTNTQEDGWHDIGWSTKRAGTVAYDRAGCAISTSPRYFPVFAQRSELEAAGVNPDNIPD